ncbi:hypothetical protein FIU91_16700 [Roseivivax sp. THAF30]|nr:hypothetical protein FIU91_16700 [Roseivivax sp. THAF30]
MPVHPSDGNLARNQLCRSSPPSPQHLPASILRQYSGPSTSVTAEKFWSDQRRFVFGGARSDDSAAQSRQNANTNTRASIPFNCMVCPCTTAVTKPPPRLHRALSLGTSHTIGTRQAERFPKHQVISAFDTISLILGAIGKARCASCPRRWLCGTERAFAAVCTQADFGESLYLHALETGSDGKAGIGQQVAF